MKKSHDLDINELYSRNYLVGVNEIAEKFLQSKMWGFCGCGIGMVTARKLISLGIIKRIVIADHDIIEESNLNRLGVDKSAIGMSKVHYFKKEIEDIHPDVEVYIHHTKINKDNFLKLFGDCDIIMNTVDFDTPLYFELSKIIKKEKKIEVFNCTMGNGAFAYSIDYAKPGAKTFSERHQNKDIKTYQLYLLEYFLNKYFKDNPNLMSMFAKYKEYGHLVGFQPQNIVGVSLAALMALESIVGLIIEDKDYHDCGISIKI
jgi:predicted ThiF/HesA family dinucleotide-utilizing enzyme